MDHPGALRHPADREAACPRDRDLRARVRRQDRVRGGVAAVGRELGGGGAGAREHLVQRAAARRSRRSRARRSPRARARARWRGPRRRRSASASPWAPGRRVRDARVDQHRLRLRRSSRWRFETVTGAAWTRFVVHSAAPTARGTERTTATSGLPDGRIPAATPLATNPCAAVTDTARRAPRRGGGRRCRRARARG